jgi:hypothetical protein
MPGLDGAKLVGFRQVEWGRLHMVREPGRKETRMPSASFQDSASRGTTLPAAADCPRSQRKAGAGPNAPPTAQTPPQPRQALNHCHNQRRHLSQVD